MTRPASPPSPTPDPDFTFALFASVGEVYAAHLDADKKHGPNWCNHCEVNHHKNTKCPYKLQQEKGKPSSFEGPNSTGQVKPAKPGEPLTADHLPKTVYYPNGTAACGVIEPDREKISAMLNTPWPEPKLLGAIAYKVISSMKLPMNGNQADYFVKDLIEKGVLVDQGGGKYLPASQLPKSAEPETPPPAEEPAAPPTPTPGGFVEDEDLAAHKLFEDDVPDELEVDDGGGPMGFDLSSCKKKLLQNLNTPWPDKGVAGGQAVKLVTEGLEFDPGFAQSITKGLLDIGVLVKLPSGKYLPKNQAPGYTPPADPYGGGDEDASPPAPSEPDEEPAPPTGVMKADLPDSVSDGTQSFPVDDAQKASILKVLHLPWPDEGKHKIQIIKALNDQLGPDHPGLAHMKALVETLIAQGVFKELSGGMYLPAGVQSASPPADEPSSAPAPGGALTPASFPDKIPYEGGPVTFEESEKKAVIDVLNDDWAEGGISEGALKKDLEEAIGCHHTYADAVFDFLKGSGFVQELPNGKLQKGQTPIGVTSPPSSPAGEVTPPGPPAPSSAPALPGEPPADEVAQAMGWNPSGKGVKLLQTLNSKGPSGVTVDDAIAAFEQGTGGAMPSKGVAGHILHEALKKGFVQRVPGSSPPRYLFTKNEIPPSQDAAPTGTCPDGHKTYKSPVPHNCPSCGKVMQPAAPGPSSPAAPAAPSPGPSPGPSPVSPPAGLGGAVAGVLPPSLGETQKGKVKDALTKALDKGPASLGGLCGALNVASGYKLGMPGAKKVVDDLIAGGHLEIDPDTNKVGVPVPKAEPKAAPPAPSEPKPHPYPAMPQSQADMPDGSGLTTLGSADALGGVHYGKKYVQDAQGRKYLFKPDHFGRKVNASVAAASIGEKILDPGSVVPVKAVTLPNGSKGSIQPMHPGAVGDLSHVPLTSLTDIEKNDLQAERVLDWLTSNHDSKTDNLLRLDNGHIIGIDKEQAFKWIGDDKLSTSYKPNPLDPVYNPLYQAYASKKINLDPNVIRPIFDRVDAIPDTEYLAMVQPALQSYAEEFAWSPQKVNQVKTAVLARKHNLRQDMETFYNSLRQKRGEPPVSFAKGSPVTARRRSPVSVVAEAL